MNPTDPNNNQPTTPQNPAVPTPQPQTPPPPMPQTPPASVPPPAGGPTPTIAVKKLILIEDEQSIRELYKRQFDLSGFQTDAFGNGKDGLAALSQNHYDIMLLDIMLPDINGLQILKEVKSNEKTKEMPVFMLTNLGQEVTIKEGFALGAESYLIKSSYTPDQIILEINNALAKNQRG